MKTVLVIDGAGHDLEALQKLLRDNGYAVCEMSESARRVEEALQQSEKRYRSIFENAPIGMFRSSPEGKLLSVNPAVSRMLKYDSSEEMLEAVNWTSIAEELYLEPGHREEILERVLRGPGWVASEERFRCKDGSIIDCYFHLCAVLGADGKPFELDGFIEDITELKQAERTLYLTQFAIDKTIDQAFWMTPDGRLFYVNEAACASLGYSREELVGMSVPDIDPLFPMENWPRHWQEVKKSGGTRFESFHQARDGRVYPVEVRANFVVFDGKEYNCAFVTDISERKRAEEDLQRTNELLRAIIEAAPTAIIDLDLEGNVRNVWNPAAEQMLGWSAHEVMGRPLPSVPVESQEEYRRFREWIKSGKTLDGIEVRRQRRDGSPIDYSIYASPLRDADDSIIGNIAVLVDITERKRAEEKLLELSQMLQMVLDNMPAFVFWKDRNSVYLGCNRLFAANAGLSFAEEIVGLTDLDLPWKHDEAESYRTDDRTVMGTGVPKLNYEETQRIADGRVTWVRTSKIPLKDLGGNVIGVLGTFEDITEQKQAEEALRESEREYRSIVEHAPFGITRSTRDGKLVSVNPALAAILKYDSAEELLETINRSSIQDVLFPNPSERAPLVKNILSNDSWHIFNNRLRCKDGSIVTCRVHSRRIVDEAGRTSEFESFQENITEQMAAEQALRESEEKFRVLAETSPAAICLYQGERLIYANPAMERLFGYSADELCRMKFWDWAHEDFRELIRERGLARLRGEAVSGQYEASYITKAGDERVMLVSAGVMEYRGRPTGVASFLDISERKRTEELIRASLREKEVLLKEIHHRVKNNLQVVSSLLFLQSQKIQDPELAAHFTESQNRIYSMALAHEQLYQSKNLADLRLPEYVENLVGQIEQVFRSGENTVCCRVDVDDIELDIEQVVPCGLLITELLSNALRHAFPGDRSGIIDVELHRQDSLLCLAVRDDGIGLPADLDFVTPKTLGLQLVRALTYQLDGTLELERRTGTEFRVTFPARNRKELVDL